MKSHAPEIPRFRGAEKMKESGNNGFHGVTGINMLIPFGIEIDELFMVGKIQQGLVD